jgi:hypothetical protein
MEINSIRRVLNLKSYVLPGEAGDQRTRFTSHFHFAPENGFVVLHWIFCLYSQNLCWSQWPRVLRRRYAAARLLRSWVRIPPGGAWLFVCCECCVLSGGGFCDELITRPEESYLLWCVVVRGLEKPRVWEGHDPRWVAAPQKNFLGLVEEWLKILDVHMTVHRDQFLIIKPTTCTKSSNLFLG